MLVNTLRLLFKLLDGGGWDFDAGSHWGGFLHHGFLTLQLHRLRSFSGVHDRGSCGVLNRNRSTESFRAAADFRVVDSTRTSSRHLEWVFEDIIDSKRLRSHGQLLLLQCRLIVLVNLELLIQFLSREYRRMR